MDELLQAIEKRKLSVVSAGGVGPDDTQEGLEGLFIQVILHIRVGHLCGWFSGDFWCGGGEL